MKKFIYLCLLLFLAGCTSIENLVDNKNENIIEKNYGSEELKTQEIILNSSDPAGILNDISNSLKRGYVRE